MDGRQHPLIVFLEGTTIEVGESTIGVNSLSRTPQRNTLELAMRIGHQSIRVLVDLGSTGNRIDA